MQEKEIMREIWKETLNLEKLPDLDESFFDLGGNSFVATQVCFMFEEKTGKTIDIVDFYDNETINQLVK